jgi:hypothetical protein
MKEGLFLSHYDRTALWGHGPCLVASSEMKFQRIRLKQFEMPTPGTNRVGRHSRITPAIEKAPCDILIEQPYLYRYEMADFLYRKFRKRVSERSIGRFLRSIGWTRTMIHRIAQQREGGRKASLGVSRQFYLPWYVPLSVPPSVPPRYMYLQSHNKPQAYPAVPLIKLTKNSTTPNSPSTV